MAAADVLQRMSALPQTNRDEPVGDEPGDDKWTLELIFAPDNPAFRQSNKDPTIYWHNDYRELTHPDLFLRANKTRTRLIPDLRETLNKLSTSKRRRIYSGGTLFLDIEPPEDRFKVRLTGHINARAATRILMTAWVWVQCSDNYSIKKTKKRLEELGWLRNADCAPVYVYLEPIIAAGDVSAPREIIYDDRAGTNLGKGYCLHVDIARGINGVAGCPCRSRITLHSRVVDESYCRIGGVVQLNASFDVLLTTGHGFLGYFILRNISLVDKDDTTEFLVNNDDDDSSETSNGSLDEDVVRLPAGESLESFTPDNEKIGYVDFSVQQWQLLQPVNTMTYIIQAKQTEAEHTWDFIARSYDADYALFNINASTTDSYTPVSSPRSFIKSSDTCLKEAEKTEESQLSVEGEIAYIVLDSEQEIPVTILPDAINVSMCGVKFSMLKLSTPTILAQGTSGLWVSRGTELCGIIVALYPSEASALMIPAKTMVQNVIDYGTDINQMIYSKENRDSTEHKSPFQGITVAPNITKSLPLKDSKVTQSKPSAVFASPSGILSSSNNFRSSPMATPVVLRIAIAGAGGLAALLTKELCKKEHAVLVLSRKVHPEFESTYGCQVAVVDYHNLDNLQFPLHGIDLVISTISNAEQINLIEAARRARVRCFVPSEFEGSLSHRPANGYDPFDTGSAAALAQLRHWASSRNNSMKYTVFSCGIFFERFAPGGLRAYNMGDTCRFPNEEDYLKELPTTNAQGGGYKICMTSALDVARFVTAAVGLGIDNWPREFKMRGSRLTPQKIQQYCSEVRQLQFDKLERPFREVADWAEHYQQERDEPKWLAMQHLLQTALGRYSFDEANLNDLVNVEPTGFKDWLYNN